MAHADPGTQQAPRGILLLLGVWVVTLVAYMPTLGGGLLWDDHHLVPAAERAFLDALSLFRSSFWSEQDWASDGQYYRPVVLLSLGLDAYIHGDNAAGFRLTNLVLHLVNVGLLFGCLSRVAQSVKVPTAPVWLRGGAVFFLSTCFALHPRLAECVAWVSGRTDLLAGVLGFGALWVWGESAWRRGCAALLLLLGLLSKEVAVASAAALLISEWHRQRAVVPVLRKVWPVLATCAVYALLRNQALPLLQTENALGVVSRSQLFLEAIGRYAWMLVNPFQPEALQGDVRYPSLLFQCSGGLVLLLFAAVMFKRRSYRLAGEAVLPGALVAAALLPVLWIWPLPTASVTADRFLYFPLFGALSLSLPWVVRLFARSRLGASVGVLFLGLLAWRTTLRAETFSDEGEFWTEATRTNKTQATPLSELGSLYFRGGHLARAVACYQEAANRNRGALELSNLALAQGQLGQYAIAAPLLEEALRLQPGAAKLHLDHGLLALQQLHFENAKAAFAQCLVLQPSNTQCEQLSRELPELVRLSELQKSNASLTTEASLLASARINTRLGRTHEAIPLWLQVVMGPSFAPAIQQEAAQVLIRFGDPTQVESAIIALIERGGTLSEEVQVAWQTRMSDYARLAALPDPVRL